MLLRQRTAMDGKNSSAHTARFSGGRLFVALSNDACPLVIDVFRQPLHEAVRAGHLDVVEYLVQHGADVHARTGFSDEGESP